MATRLKSPESSEAADVKHMNHQSPGSEEGETFPDSKGRDGSAGVVLVVLKFRASRK
jgi:hypothetical protein